ncbi:MAG: peptidylprolyl isomerase [Bacteroidetes bacterium]|nr:MAG: peptidylprolyl isomerase [Bacteroidota bacterium]
MIAEKDTVVSVIYELRAGSKQGEVVEALSPDQPLTFLFGNGGLLPKFEENLNGLSEGDRFEFLLNSEDAYGPVVENAIVHVPLQIFEVDGRIDEALLKVGTTVPMMDAEGRRLNGKVVAVDEEAVKMDFNHPMAGRDLHFSGTITEIRDATEEELTHGHVHGEGSHGCGSCGDEGGHGCNCGH